MKRMPSFMTLLIAACATCGACADDHYIQNGIDKSPDKVKDSNVRLVTAKREDQSWRFSITEGSDGRHGGMRLESALLKGEGFEIDLGRGDSMAVLMNKARSFKLSDELVKSAIIELSYSYYGSIAHAQGVKLGEFKRFSIKLQEITQSANKPSHTTSDPP